jgi:RNA polymerase sigma-70 factor (ECF subfamily)
MTDTELIARIRSGDMSALEALMRLHNRRLYRTARAILRDDAEAEEAVQDAYLRAFRALGTFRGESKLSTWLVRITANEALMRRRRNARTAAVICMDPEPDGQVSGEPGPESDAQRAEMRRLLEARVDALPEGYRAVFVLRALEELTVGETAAALGIPDATVRTRYFRARGLLRESMAGDIDTTLEDAFAFAGVRCDSIVSHVLVRLRCRTPTMNLEWPLLITEEDLRQLALLELHSELQREIGRAIVISPKVASLVGVVTMNSQVLYTDEATGTQQRVRVVYPHEADRCDCCISVLAPVGTALLGLSAGHAIEWDFPDGTRRRLRVDEVVHRAPA